MSTINKISHEGVVHSVENNKITVKIITHSACSSCKVQSICNPSESKEVFLDFNITNDLYKIGENVNVLIDEGLGFKALIFAYMLPFIFVISTIIIMLNLNISETISGITSLLILFPYYIILYFYREKIKKSFTFSLEKR